MERFVFLTIAMVCNQLQQFHITAQTNVSCIEYGKQYFICVYRSLRFADMHKQMKHSIYFKCIPWHNMTNLHIIITTILQFWHCLCRFNTYASRITLHTFFRRTIKAKCNVIDYLLPIASVMIFHICLCKDNRQTFMHSIIWWNNSNW